MKEGMRSLTILVLAAFGTVSSTAQSPPARYGLGRPAPADLIAAWDIAVANRDRNFEHMTGAEQIAMAVPVSRGSDFAPLWAIAGVIARRRVIRPPGRDPRAVIRVPS